MRIRNVLVCSADFPVDVIGDDGKKAFVQMDLLQPKL